MDLSVSPAPVGKFGVGVDGSVSLGTSVGAGPEGVGCGVGAAGA